MLALAQWKRLSWMGRIDSSRSVLVVIVASHLPFSKGPNCYCVVARQDWNIALVGTAEAFLGVSLKRWKKRSRRGECHQAERSAGRGEWMALPKEDVA